MRLSTDLVTAEIAAIVAAFIADSELPEDIVRAAVTSGVRRAATELYFLARLAA